MQGEPEQKPSPSSSERRAGTPETPSAAMAMPKASDDPLDGGPSRDVPPDANEAQGGAARQPTSGLVVSFVAAALVGALAFGTLGDRTASSDAPASETTSVVYWIAAVIVIAGAGAGAQYAERTATAAAAAIGQPRRTGPLPTAWAVPAVATFGAILLVASYHNIWMLAAGPLIAFVGIAGSLFSRDLLDDVGDTANRVASIVHALVIHFVAFIALGTIYLNKLPDWAGATLAALVAGALMLETLERAPVSAARRLTYAGIAALVLWQATIAVNWWRTSGWTGGMVLLVVFYLVAGVLLLAAQQPAPRPRDLLWYGGLSAVALVILALTS